MKVQINAYQLRDGSEGTVAIVNRALVEYDATRVRRKWPTIADAPFTFQTFTTWKALQLAGRYPGTYDDFLNDCVAIEPQEETEDADPTPTGTAADS